MRSPILRCLVIFLLLAGFAPASASLPAQVDPPNPYLLKDINTRTSELSKLRGFMEYQGLVFYFAGLPGETPALWKSDGTPQNTQKVKGGILGGGSAGYANGHAWAVYNNFLYFEASDAQFGEEIWRTDGTTEGTYLLADLAPGAPSSTPSAFVEYNGGLYFIALYDLWRTDGVSVERLTGANVEVDAWVPLYYEGLLVFAASDPLNGEQLWRTDGTPGGTGPSALLPPGVHASVHPLLVDQGNLYFTASDGETASGGHGAELWVTDGTLAGSRLFADINPTGDSFPSQMMRFPGGLVFTAKDSLHGREVWWTPGMTIEGVPIAPALVGDLYPGSPSSGAAFLGTLGSRFLFFAWEGPGACGLWALTGAEPVLQRVHDAWPITGTLNFEQEMVVFLEQNGNNYFPSNAGASGMELWRTDGTPEGTQLVVDIWPGPMSGYPHELAHCGLWVCFPADDGDHGTELWRSDGTAAGSALVYDLNTTRPGSDPQNLTAAGSLLYFTADDGIHGRGLWRTDGTPGGTFSLNGEIDPLNWSFPPPNNLTAMGERLYFTANDGEYGVELWVTSGQPGSTRRLADLFPGGGNSNPTLLTPAGQRLFFIARMDLYRYGLYDVGADDDVRLVKEFPNDKVGYRKSTAALGADLFYLQYDQFSPQRASLWRSDGTAGGTQVVFSELSTPGELVVVHSLVMFSGKDLSDQPGLWKTDGTIQGTIRIALPASAPSYTFLSKITAVNEQVFFFAVGSGSTDLYRVDFHQNEAILVQSFSGSEWPPTPYTRPLAYAGRLIFSLQQPDYTMVTFASDGTLAGTQPIPGGIGFIDGLTPAGPFLFFSKSDPDHGTELWRWDGSSNEPVRVADIYPGTASSNPAALEGWRTWLYFSANDGVHGAELWAYDIPVHQVFLPVTSR